MLDDVEFSQDDADSTVALPSSLDPGWPYWRPFGPGKLEREAVRAREEAQDNAPARGPDRNTTPDFDTESATKPMEYFEDGVLEGDDALGADPFEGLTRWGQPWEVARRGAPGWSFNNWNREITNYEARGAAYHAVRALKRAKNIDANAFISRERASTYSDHELQQKLRSAWVKYHPKWAKAEAARIVRDFHTAKEAAYARPYSRNSIVSGLSQLERQTFDAYRKLVKRHSQATGKRDRTKPGKTRQALAEWEALQPSDAIVLRWLAGPIEDGAEFFAKQIGTDVKRIPVRVAGALRRWQKFKEEKTATSRQSKSPIRPTGLP